MIEVYHWEPNAHQAKPMMVLYEKGVPFVSHYVDLLALEHVSSAYLKLCPTGLVPCIIEDGRLVIDALSLSETTDYCEQIDEIHPHPPLRPEEAEDRWRMRWWSLYMDRHLSPALSTIGWKTFMGPEARRRHSPEVLERFLESIPSPETYHHWSTAIHDTFTDEQLAESHRRVEEGIALLENVLSKRPYLACDSYSIADLVAFSTLYAFPMSNQHLANAQKTPGLWAWLKRLHARPAMVKTFELGRMRYGERVKAMRAELGLPA